MTALGNQYAVGNNGGRPTDYSQEMVSKVKEYLTKNQDDVVEVHLPTLEGCALYLGIAKPTLLDWESKYPEFSVAVKAVRTEQHDRLVNKGLSGQYNPTIAKLLLGANHNVREKTEQDIHLTGNVSLTTLLTKANDESRHTANQEVPEVTS